MNKLIIILTLLLSAASIEAGETYPAIFYAAYNNDVGVANNYILSGESIEIRDAQGRTPLIAAAEIGNKEVLLFLLESGADIKATVNGLSILDLAKSDDVLSIIKKFNKARQADKTSSCPC